MAGDPLYVSGSDSDPVVKWINRAIQEARSKLPQIDPEKAKDPFYVLSFALNVIIKTRELGVSVPGVKGLLHPNCNDMSLAYADHYLQMRADAFNLGPKSRGFLQQRGEVYDGLKSKALKHGATRWVFETGVCAPSPVTDQEKYWAQRGLEDGLKDYNKHPHSTAYPRHPLSFNPI